MNELTGMCIKTETESGLILVTESCSTSDQSGPAILTESFCQLSGHAGRVTGLAWSIHADGQLVSTSYDGTAQVMKRSNNALLLWSP